MSVFDWMETSLLGSAVRDHLWVYPMLLVLHAVGLAFTVGVNLAIALRVFGVATALPVQPFARFLPALYAAFAVNAISGVGLVFNNPSKWLVDPVFYTKLVLLVLAMVALQLLNRRVLRAPGALNAGSRTLAATSMLLWTGALVTGRLMGYTFFR
jgi:hypothetical protein